MMQLDDVVSSVNVDFSRFVEATDRSIRWLDRCIAAHSRKDEQNLFGIIQGGLDVSPGGLREKCLNEMIKRDLPGYAIGGLAGGEDKDLFWRVVAHNAEHLPSNKPRYLMGVGYPLDLVVCVALGVDMFDCVYPSRTARFGVALVPSGMLKLRGTEFSSQNESVDSTCSCYTCRYYSRGFLHAAFRDSNALGPQLLTKHNISYMMKLMRDMRRAIIDGDVAYHRFINDFLSKQFGTKDLIPKWVVDALTHAGVPIEFPTE